MAACLSYALRSFRLQILLSSQNLRFRSLHTSQICGSNNSSSGDPSDPKYASRKDKPISETQAKHHMNKLSSEPVKGKICKKQPVKILLEAGKTYFFCTCGYSKNQPFCDSSHKAPNFVDNRPFNIRYQPLPFTVEETKEYWLCLCKQSNKRPFCDGTHKRQDIQAAVGSQTI